MTASVYYVLVGGSGQPVWPAERLRAQQADAVSQAAAKSSNNGSGIKLLGYSIDELWLRAVLEAPNVRAIHNFLRLACGECKSQTDYTRDARSGVVPQAIRYVQLNYDEDELLALRHCHLAPVQLGLVEVPEDWPCSTHQSYLGLKQTPGLYRNRITRLLASGLGGWPLAYRLLVSDPEPGENVLRLPTRALVIPPNAEPNGDRAFLRMLALHPRERRRERVFNEVVAQVCDTTDCDVDEFMAAPGSPPFRLQRALLLHEFRDRRPGIINVNELARRLRTDRSWLYRTLKDCRVAHPGFFDTSNLNEMRLNHRYAGAWWQSHVPVAAIAYQALGVSVQMTMGGSVDLSALLARHEQAPSSAAMLARPPELVSVNREGTPPVRSGTDTAHTMDASQSVRSVPQSTQSRQQDSSTRLSGKGRLHGDVSGLGPNSGSTRSPDPGDAAWVASRPPDRNIARIGGGPAYPSVKALHAHRTRTRTRELHMECDGGTEETARFRRK